MKLSWATWRRENLLQDAGCTRASRSPGGEPGTQGRGARTAPAGVSGEAHCPAAVQKVALLDVILGVYIDSLPSILNLRCTLFQGPQ